MTGHLPTCRHHHRRRGGRHDRGVAAQEGPAGPRYRPHRAQRPSLLPSRHGRWVGGGAYDVAKTKRPMKDFIPSGVHWIQQRVTAIDPDQRLVTLEDGRTVNYGWLVVRGGYPDSTGSRSMAWWRVSAPMASPATTAMNSPPYTWECAKGLRNGQRALFTQPQMPIKCAGAPQKAMYLTADHLRKQGVQADIRFAPPGPSHVRQSLSMPRRSTRWWPTTASRRCSAMN